MALCPRCDQPTHPSGRCPTCDLPEAPAPIGPGSRIGEYVLIELLDHGAMGEVWRGAHAGLDARGGARLEVAVKLMLPAIAARPDLRGRFAREAAAHARIDHPAVPRFYAWGEAGERPYLVMALIPGPTLKQILARGLLPIAQAREIARQLAHCLDHLHRHGIVHRDLKPANIKVAGLPEHPRVFVLDLGICKALGDWDASLATHAMLGTPAYMAPEMLSDASRVEPAADQFALGALLYEMLTGERAFAAGSAAASLLRIHSHMPPPPSTRRRGESIDPALDALVRRLLDKDPAHRYPDMSAVATALDTPELPSAPALAPTEPPSVPELARPEPPVMPELACPESPSVPALARLEPPSVPELARSESPSVSELAPAESSSVSPIAPGRRLTWRQLLQIAGGLLATGLVAYTCHSATAPGPVPADPAPTALHEAPITTARPVPLVPTRQPHTVTATHAVSAPSGAGPGGLTGPAPDAATSADTTGTASAAPIAAPSEPQDDAPIARRAVPPLANHDRPRPVASRSARLPMAGAQPLAPAPLPSRAATPPPEATAVVAPPPEVTAVAAPPPEVTAVAAPPPVPTAVAAPPPGPAAAAAPPPGPAAVPESHPTRARRSSISDLEGIVDDLNRRADDLSR